MFFGGVGGVLPPKKIAKNHHRTNRYIPLRVESNQFSGYRDLKGQMDRQTDRWMDGRTDTDPVTFM